MKKETLLKMLEILEAHWEPAFFYKKKIIKKQMSDQEIDNLLLRITEATNWVMDEKERKILHTGLERIKEIREKERVEEVENLQEQNLLLEKIDAL